jgi:hypothetical protein
MIVPPGIKTFPLINGAHFRSRIERGNRQGAAIAAQEVFDCGIARRGEVD